MKRVWIIPAIVELEISDTSDTRCGGIYDDTSSGGNSGLPGSGPYPDNPWWPWPGNGNGHVGRH